MGGTGWAWRGRRERTQENWGVLTAGIWTMVVRTALPSWSSSLRKDSLKPWIACLAPQ